MDVSYLADTVVMLRHFEARGQLSKALTVVKKRSGLHDNSIREFALTKEGVVIGAPLVRAQGLFSGVPRLDGELETTRS